jgi:hypothetical protein
VPLHSLQPGDPHAKPTLSNLSTTENPFSTSAELPESLSLFPISRQPQPRHTLRNRCAWEAHGCAYFRVVLYW